MASNETLDPRDFVRLWMQAANEGRNQQWVGQQLGRTQRSVASTFYKLRKRGVKLPPLPSGRNGNRPPSTTNELNKIIEEQRHVRD